MFEHFDFDTYKGLLRWISRDRPCVSFPGALKMNGGSYCIVRHDVDFSLTAALRMAKVEAELGISATYFLLFSAFHYNLLTRDNSRVPRALIELGHEVGLHYDSGAVAHLPPDDAVKLLQAQAALLGALSGNAVTAIARHNPGFGGVDPMERATEFVNAYHPRFTTEIEYVSDSCGAWREESLDVLAAAEPPRNLQLLIHPIFWDEQHADRWAHLERLRREGVEEIDAQAAVAREVWSDHPAVSRHDERVRAAGIRRSVAQHS